MRQTDAHAEVRDLCEQIRCIANIMPGQSRTRMELEQASDAIETITRAWMTPTMPDTWPGAEPLVVALLNFLKRRMGTSGDYCTRDQIMDALYGGRNPDEWPDRKIISVLVSHARATLLKSGSKFSVDSRIGYWGGFRLVSRETGDRH